MKTIIAGGRNYTNMTGLYEAIDKCGWQVTSVVSGGATGADRLGEMYASNMELPLIIVPAQWNKYGKSAGRLRNIEMANQSEALIALWDGSSRGTYSMIHIAEVRKLKVFVLDIA